MCATKTASTPNQGLFFSGKRNKSGGTCRERDLAEIDFAFADEWSTMLGRPASNRRKRGSNESSCEAEVQLHRPHINDSLRNMPPQLFLLSCVISMLFSIFLA